MEANTTSTTWLGYSKGELIGMDINIIISPEHAAKCPEMHDHVKTFGENIFETVYQRRDGSEIPVEVNCQLFRYNEDDAFLNVYRDISERKKLEKLKSDSHHKLEKAVQKRTRQLKIVHNKLLHSEKLAAIGRLSASIAHEFNNPLYGIQNVLEGIQNNCHLEDEYQGLIELSLAECRRVKQLIQNLQDFNRPSPGTIEPVQINILLEQILMMIQKKCTVGRIEIRKEYQEHLPPISGVADQLKQVFLNLINNGVDAMEEGGGVLSIKTTTQRNNIAIHISDTGHGIRPKNMKTIFEPFFTTKEALKGTGLGLSVSHGIIQQHQGTIKVKSKLEEGTTFSILLPIAS